METREGPFWSEWRRQSQRGGKDRKKAQKGKWKLNFTNLKTSPREPQSVCLLIREQKGRADKKEQK